MEHTKQKTLKKSPPPADRQGEDATLHQSTTVKTSSSDIPFVLMPDSPLPKPASTEEQIQQAAAFLRQMFHPDEWFELTPAILGRDDKLRPRRNKKNIVQLELSDFTEIIDNFREFREFKEPQHEEFAEPTRWSLLNAFTENAKKYSPARADVCYRGLTRLFGLDGQPPTLWK